MRVLACAAATSLVLGLAGCATLSPEAVTRLNQPLEMALTVPAGMLRLQAEAGDAQAQLALSVAGRYGLNGETFDEAQAGRWARQAGRPRGFTPITQYIAGYKGHPSRVITTSIPRYDVSPLQVSIVHRCAALLARPPAASELRKELEGGACGGEGRFQRLSVLWAQARAS